MKKLIRAVFIPIYIFWLVSCLRVPSTEIASLKLTLPTLLSWNTDPNSRVMLATYCCDGPVGEELVRPYIPEAQVWGDGRFLWSQHDDDGARQVFVKPLSVDEMTVMLQEIAASGFFDWNEKYQGEPVVDAASQCLTVTLTDQDKTVCTTHGVAPDAFYALFTWLAEGAGTSGTLYWPERAYLTRFQLEDTDVLQPRPDVAWPEPLAHIPIAEAITGFWLEDEETLRSFWEATNRNPYHMPVVEDRDGRYRLILQVPGVSWIEP